MATALMTEFNVKFSNALGRILQVLTVEADSLQDAMQQVDLQFDFDPTATCVEISRPPRAPFSAPGTHP